MKYKWINEYNNKRIIVFFNGWGMDENVINHLEYDDFDILMFYDYNTLETDFNFDLLKNYQERILIAWSMGVMIASLFNSLDFTYKIAINGTLAPIDSKLGILPKVYDLTIKNFNEINSRKFIDNMFDKTPTKQNRFTNRNLTEQLSELIAIKNYHGNTDFKYDKILISDNDKIIPTKSQINFWNIEPNLKCGHCPFFEYKKWSDFL